jgi:hypothetical protein
MRNFQPIHPPADFDSRLVNILKNLNTYLAQTSAGFKRIERGESPNAGGSLVSESIADHHKLSSLATYDDHPQYLYLPGRAGGQIGHGAVPTLGDIAGTWANGGNFTSKANKSSLTTWSGIAIDTSAAVGDIIILFLTSEFTIATASNGPASRHTSITDTKGNTWVKIKEHQFSDGFGEGGTHSAWKCVVTTALIAGSDTLTAVYTNTMTAMGISSHRWTGSSTNVSLVGITSLGEQGFGGGEPSILTLSNLPSSVQYLFIRGSAKFNYSGSVPGYAASANYTIFDNSTSGTGGGAANTGVFGEYRIVSSASDSTNPSADGGAYASIYLALAIFPSVIGGLTLTADTLPDAAKIDAQRQSLFLYGHDIQFRDVATSTTLSYVRTSADGAFVGPMVPQTLFDVQDSIFRIVGSADLTKKVAFEVDGLTTATTRILTVPNVDGTIILSQGTSTGQVIGTGAHTGGTVNSLAIEGPLLLGDITGINFTAGRMLEVRLSPTVSNLTGINIQYNLATIATVSGTMRGLQIALSGTLAASSGSATMQGFFFTSTASVPTGVTLSESLGGLFQSSSVTSGGTITKSTGLRAIVLGSNASTTTPTIAGFEIQLANRSANVTDANFIQFLAGVGGVVGTIASLRFVDIGAAAVLNSAQITDWIGIRIPDAPTLPVGLIRGLHIGNIKSHHVGPIRFGDTTTPTELVEIAAGTTARGPLKLNSGALRTTPLAGLIEFLTDDYFATITTGTARVAFVLDDGTRLTAGRVPFAGTNGRLIDDADFTFAVDTLTITKIAATTLTGLLTIMDAIDVALGTTTGTKIGTATTQKLGFWNTAPNVQPTTAIAAATFVANTSAIADDSATFDGYTIGQVVAALRRAGLLA